MGSEWIEARNFGRLLTPTIEFKADLIKMDAEFRKFHANAPGEFAPNDLNRLPNVTNEFAAILIQKFPQYDKKLLKRFSRARSHFRKRRIKQILFEREQESMRSKRKKLEYR